MASDPSAHRAHEAVVGHPPTDERHASYYSGYVAVVHAFSRSPGVDRLLRSAIAERRLVAFTLHGFPRRAEPHDYGIINGVPKLFFYQLGGRSQSGRPFGWRWAVIAEMQDLRLLEERFAGARDQESGRHVQWDRLIASVSRIVD
jgi:hypothetical protein